MNKATLIACLFIAAMTASLEAQDFTNLNFEDAMVSGSSGVFATSDALPGWSAFAGTNELSTIPYNAGGSLSIWLGGIEFFGDKREFQRCSRQILHQPNRAGSQRHRIVAL